MIVLAFNYHLSIITIMGKSDNVLYCTNFPLWEAGVFALLGQKCRSPPFLP